MSYKPAPVPVRGNLRQFLTSELSKIANAFSRVNGVDLAILYAAPQRPRDGMIVYADGTVWNPGQGVGFYGYQAGAWVKL